MVHKSAFAAAETMVLSPVRGDVGAVSVEHRASGGRLSLGRVAVIVLAVAALAGVAALYLLSLSANLSTDGDDAAYIILAKALATGHGYTNIQEALPRVEAQFPPLLPLLLAPFVRLWGTGAIVQMQALVTVFALGAFVMAFAVFRRWTGSAMMALAITLGAAGSDLTWSFAHKVLTELPYLFFTLLACWLATRYAAQDRWYTWSGILAALAVAAAFLTRTVGLALCVALPLSLLLAPPLHPNLFPRKRQPRPYSMARLRAERGGYVRLCKAAFVTLILAALAGGWTLRNRLVYSGQGHNYVEKFFQRPKATTGAAPLTLHMLSQRVSTAVAFYARSYTRLIGGPAWDHGPAVATLSLVLLAATGAGLLYALARRRGIAEFYLLGYVAIVLLWPWRDLRFAVPLLPFLLYYLATAFMMAAAMVLFLGGMVMALARALRTTWRAPVWPRPPHACLLAACVLLPLTVPIGLATLHTALADRQRSYHAGEWPASADWRDFHATALWLRRCALPGSVVISRSPNLMYLWSGLPSRLYPYSRDGAYVLADVSNDRLDYVVDDTFRWTDTTALYLRPVLRHEADRFVRVYALRGTAVYVARHDRAGGTDTRGGGITLCAGNRRQSARSG